MVIRRGFSRFRCSRPRWPLRDGSRQPAQAGAEGRAPARIARQTEGGALTRIARQTPTRIARQTRISLLRISKRALTMRAAIYWAPEVDDPLWHAGCTWLGRDPESGAALTTPAPPELVAEPARYGFHATLKPPMRLATSLDALREDAAALAARSAPFALPPLAVTELAGFLALCETTPCPALGALCDACVGALDRHRAPPPEAELARRRHGGLSAREEANLARWGYPHVFDTWRFHMTISRRLAPGEMALWRPRAEAWFAAALAPAPRVATIAIFTEEAPNAPFSLAARLPLRG